MDKNTVIRKIAFEAQRQGVSPEIAIAIAAQESNFKPTAKAPGSSARGIYQFIDDTWTRVAKQFGKDWEATGGQDDPRYDVDKNVELGVAHIKDNLTSRGLDPTDPTNITAAYIDHFGGAGVGNKVINADPNAPYTPSSKAVKANPWLKGVTTAGEYVDRVYGKVADNVEAARKYAAKYAGTTPQLLGEEYSQSSGLGLLRPPTPKPTPPGTVTLNFTDPTISEGYGILDKYGPATQFVQPDRSPFRFGPGVRPQAKPDLLAEERARFAELDPETYGAQINRPAYEGVASGIPVRRVPEIPITSISRTPIPGSRPDLPSGKIDYTTEGLPGLEKADIKADIKGDAQGPISNVPRFTLRGIDRAVFGDTPAGPTPKPITPPTRADLADAMVKAQKQGMQDSWTLGPNAPYGAGMTVGEARKEAERRGYSGPAVEAELGKYAVPPAPRPTAVAEGIPAPRPKPIHPRYAEAYEPSMTYSALRAAYPDRKIQIDNAIAEGLSADEALRGIARNYGFTAPPQQPGKGPGGITTAETQRVVEKVAAEDPAARAARARAERDARASRQRYGTGLGAQIAGSIAGLGDSISDSYNRWKNQRQTAEQVLRAPLDRDRALEALEKSTGGINKGYTPRTSFTGVQYDSPYNPVVSSTIQRNTAINPQRGMAAPGAGQVYTEGEMSVRWNPNKYGTGEGGYETVAQTTAPQRAAPQRVRGGVGGGRSRRGLSGEQALSRLRSGRSVSERELGRARRSASGSERRALSGRIRDRSRNRGNRRAGYAASRSRKRKSGSISRKSGGKFN